jgi:site-specific DNA recombinase
MTAVIYARYSSDNQREESIEGQIRECTAYAEKNGITVVKHYIDRALSAKTDNRPDFQQMIKDSEKRLFDIVLVWKLDRFARNRYDSAHYEYQLERNHVKLVSATEPISDSPAGIMVKSMLTGMAEYYSAELSEKVVRGMTENVLKGKYNGGTIPIGFKVDEEKFFQVDPLKAPFVVEAFQRYNDGATMKELMNWLNDSGVTTNRNQKFTYNSVQTLLTNKRYIGENHFKDIVMPDSIPAIVDKDLFEEVQLKIKKNSRAPARHKAEDDYLLTTKLFCGMCGAMMFGECGTGRNKVVHHYYKCATAKRFKTCKKKTVRKEWLEDLVIAETMKLIQDDAVIDAIVAEVMELQDQENTTLPLLEKQMREVENGIENMLNAIQAGVLTNSTKSRLEKLEAQQKELEVRIAEEKIARPRLSENQVRFWLTRFRKLDPNVKSHRETLINTFVNAVYLYDEKVLIAFNYKDGTKTITFDEIAAKDAPEGNGSDLDCFAPPKKHEILCLVLFLLPNGAISLVQFLAHLLPNLITPPVVDLRIDCKGRAGLRVSGFCGHCCHTDVGIGQQDTDEGVPEHMWVNFFDARFFPDPAHQCCIAVGVDGKAVVVADHKVIPTQIQKRLCVLSTFLFQIFLPACTHQLFSGLPLFVIVLQKGHKLRGNIHITDVAFFRCGKLIAIIRENQQRF